MEKNKFSEKTVKAESAFNIVPQNVYLDSEYNLKIVPVSTVSQTGLLTVFRLEPSNPQLPVFLGRWDAGTNTIDVDLVGSSSDIAAFRAGRNGFQGHHPQTVSLDPRVFKIDIQPPQRRVYEALLTCNTGLGVTIKETIDFKDEVSATVTPGSTKLPEQ